MKKKSKPLHTESRRFGRQYLLQAMLPRHVEERFRRALHNMPGASWPSWGIHITLLNRFIPKNLDSVIRKIQDTVSVFQPFEIEFNRITCERHFVRPNMKTVMLTNRLANPHLTGAEELTRLRECIFQQISTHIYDLQPEVSRKKYTPHVSLTWGLPSRKASELFKSAWLHRLNLRFTVDKISLIKVVSLRKKREKMKLVEEFKLGKSSSTAECPGQF